MISLAKFATFIVIIAVGYQFYLRNNVYNHRCNLNDPGCPDRFFSSSYYEARHKFLLHAKLAQAELHSFQVIPNSDLTMDVAIINLPTSETETAKQEYLIHLSGVHGVEGYAGSAIQVAFLDEIRMINEKKRKPIIDASYLLRNRVA